MWITVFAVTTAMAIGFTLTAIVIESWKDVAKFVR